MLTYVFRAKNGEGALVSGRMAAERRETVVSALKQKGYYLLSVEKEGKLAAFLRSDAGLRGRISIRDKAIFTGQLATLLKAGMQLSIALKTLSRQTKNKYLASVIRQVHSDIEQSSSLSQAMAKHPKAFSHVYTAIIEASEQSGSLVESLSVMSRQLKMQASVNARIKGAMLYPVFLLFVSAVVVGVLTAFVIPKFIELFVNANQKLPLPTQILVGSVDFVKGFWWAIVLAAAGIVSFGFIALRQENIKRTVHGWLLKIPMIGTLNRKLQLARFARTLGSLLDGGVKIVQAVETTRGITTNQAFAQEIENIEDAILRGTTLAKSIGEQKYFSEVAVNMVAIGEETGMLPEMLLDVADMYDQDCESTISSMTNLLGPVMIVVLGLIIGFVVLAILLPIFETSTMVG